MDGEVESYDAWTDDELLNLATQAATLTPEAQVALDAEMRRRGLGGESLRAYAAESREIEKRTGDVTLVVPHGMGRRFLGSANYQNFGEEEELNTTLWISLFWMPIFPLASYRIRRKAGTRSLARYRFIVVEKYPRDWGQIAKTWLSVLLALVACIAVASLLELVLR
jgi:hypothetical protein